MNRSAVLAPLLLLIAAAAACNVHECPQPPFKGFGNGSLGDPCEATANCGHGLNCRAVYVVPGFPDPTFTSNACTVDCDTGCAAGSVCGSLFASQIDGGVSPVSECLPSCASDADCIIGITSGSCVTGACYRTQCKTDDDCPLHYTCESPAAVCCDTDTCPYTGNLPGYCRKPDDAGM